MIYRFDPFSLDSESLELRKGGETVPVEPQVFSVLAYLIERRDRVVGKEELIDAVWGGRAISDGALNSRINSARRAVGDDGAAQSVIRTFTRRGFRFVAEVNEAQAPSAPPAAGRPVPADKPSIAVLPFANLSNDPEQEYFSDGIAEDIIAALGRFHWFFVVARNSSFSYRDAAPDSSQVARDLGVRYVLEGSVRKSGNRVRVAAQLVDALNGRHIWAERYDRELDDIFAVQDEITEAIAAAVAPSFVSAEARRVDRKPPEDFDAWDHVMRGHWRLWRLGKENVADARREFERAIECDPNSAIAYSGLAGAITMEMMFGWTDSPELAAEEAYRAATRAIELDDGDASAHGTLAFVHFFGRRPDAAIESCERALALNPNLAFAEAVLASVYCWTGEYDATIRHIERSERLSPRDPVLNLFGIAQATAEFCAGRYEKAADLARKVTDMSPNSPSAWRMLTSSSALSGRDDDARAALSHLLQLAPGLTVAHCRRTVPTNQTAYLETYLDGLRKAGLPE